MFLESFREPHNYFMFQVLETTCYCLKKHFVKESSKKGGLSYKQQFGTFQADKSVFKPTAAFCRPVPPSATYTIPSSPEQLFGAGHEMVLPTS